MDKTQFWSLIKASRNSQRDCSEQAAKLKKLLSKLSAEEIAEFDRIFGESSDLAYRWDLWGTAHIINGGASEDGFQYFRWWLIGQGREIFEGALQNPDSLADFTDDEEAEYEEIAYCIAEAYEEKTGGEMPKDPNGYAYSPSQPIGKRWKESELAAHLPKLAAKFY